MTGIFLFGEDSIDDVKTIRNDAIAALSGGTILEWSSENTTVKKVGSLPLDVIIKEANAFLRLYDSTIRQNNPMITRTRPNLS